MNIEQMIYNKLKKRLPKKLFDEYEKFNKNYVLESGHSGTETSVLEDSGDQTCRFCTKPKGEVSFKNEAHIFPVLMNNSKLTSKFECDICNKKFSQYESDFGEYFSFERAIFGLKKRKNKIPKHKNPKRGAIIEKATNEKLNRIGHNLDLSKYPNTLLISNLDKKIFEDIKDDPKSNKLDFPITRKPYRPLNVYRVLQKIGFSMINEKEIKSFESWRQFLINDQLELKKDDEKGKGVFSVIIRELPNFNRYPIAFLYKKRDENLNNYVDKILVLFWLDKTFQLPILSDNNDEYYKLNNDINTYPHPALLNPHLCHLINDKKNREFLNNSKITTKNFYRTRLEKEDSFRPSLTLKRPYVGGGYGSWEKR